MTETLEVYTYAGVHVATVAPKKGSARWSQTPGEDGSASFAGLGDLADAALADDTYVRINNGTKDVFGFVPVERERVAVDAGDDGGTNARRTEIELAGPGLRHLLHATQIYQEDTSDCAEPADERIFGWQSAAYDRGGWARALSFGTFLSGPWQTPRPTNWPASLSEYITISLDPIAAQTDWGALASITLDAEGDYIVLAAADDEYRVWIDGTLIMDTFDGGPFQWREYQQHPMKLCAGTHIVAVQVRNLARPAGLEASNYTWLQFALAPAGSNGKPRSANQQYAVYTDATGGTFTLSSTFGDTTAAIDWNATAAQVQTRLEALATVGAGNVNVTGAGNVQNTVYELSHNHTGGTFTLESEDFVDTAPIAWNATALEVENALEAITSIGPNVTVTGAGTAANPWRIEFDNARTYEDYTLGSDGTGLTGGTTFTLSKTSTGNADPWLITFQGDLVSKHIPLTVDGGALTGGTGINVDEYVRGRGADAVMKSSTSWVVRDFTDGVPGLTATQMLRIAVEDGRARGATVADNLTFGFTDTTDTKGATLPELVLPVPLDADVHRLAIMLEEAGYLVDVAPDLTVQCWKDRGVDRTATVSVTAWSAGVRDLRARQSKANVKNVLRVRTDDGWHEVIEAASVTARGRWEDGTILTGFANAAEAELITGPVVARHATPARVTTLELTSEGPVVPYRDFDIADILTASAWAAAGFDTTGMRWAGVTARIEETHTIYRLQLVD